MKSKVLSGLFTLVLVLGFSLVPAVPAMAAPTDAEIINYSFSLLGETDTINSITGTISVTVPDGTVVTGMIATFNTSTGITSIQVGTTDQISESTVNDFSNPVTYTVTAQDETTTKDWVVTVRPANNPTAPDLGEAGRFVILAGTIVTTTSGSHIYNGDIALLSYARSTYAGFTSTGPAGDFIELTNGTSYASDDSNPDPFPYPLHYATLPVGAQWTTTGAMITQVSSDLGSAYSFLAADPNQPPNAPTQVCPTALGGLTLTRGVYKTASDVTIPTALHLDAQGDPDSVWIFSIDGTLTTGATGNIFLDNGAQAKNVYWRVAGVTTIAASTTFCGNVFNWAQVNVLTGATITGRLFSVNEQVTLDADNVTLIVAPLNQEMAIFSAGGTWIIDTNRNGAFDPGVDWSNSPNTFGRTAGDVPLAIDWNGDGVQELAIFRQGGTWFIDINGDGAFDPGVDWSNSPNTFGRNVGDVPLAIDADGDGVQELAIFRQGGTWFIDMNHNGAFEAGIDWSNSPNTFGRTAGDVPLAIDWDGDGIQELGIFRQGGTWFIDMNHNGAFEVGVDWSNSPNTFGRNVGDIPISIDYNGDGIQELGIFRDGTWFGDMNHNGVFDLGIDLTNSPNEFGEEGDIPLAIG